MTQVQQQPQQQNNQPQPPAVKKFEESTVDSVLNKVNDFKGRGELILPSNYSVDNAVRSAWLMIQQAKDINKKPALEVCTKESIANAMLDMVLQGLSPVKKQCYFIVYGNTLTMQKSYFGTIAVSKRVAGVKDAIGVPIYQNDTFKYTIDVTTGIKTVTQHDQDFDNIDITKLKGAYAVINYEDGTIEYEVMTMQQIRTAWAMGASNGNSPAHKNFPDQMACKTVIGRALKVPVNSSLDDDLFEEELPDIKGKQIEEGVKLEIKNNANGNNADHSEPLGFEDVNDKTPVITEPITDDQKPLQENNLTDQQQQPVLNNGQQQQLPLQDPLQEGRPQRP